MYAFVRIETPDDIRDLIVLLGRGATVGIEAVPGALFGPTAPLKFDQGARAKRLIYGPMPLSVFLATYLDQRGIFKSLWVEECPDKATIKAVWRVLNHSAGTWLTASQIIKLCRVLADHYGGTIEPQIGYGAEGWLDGVKAGHTLVCWTRPSLAELTDFVKYGVGSIVNATMVKPWFAGVSGPYQMPNRGLIRYVAGMTPADAWEASGPPTGISAAWERTAAFYRLCGLVVEAEATDEELKAPGWAAMKHAAKQGARPQDAPVRPVRTIPRKGGGAWLHENWESVTRIRFG